MSVKKVWIGIIALILCISALGGCGSDVEEKGPVKSGISIRADVTGSKDASAEDLGMANADVLVVAVTVNDNGVIDDCIIDEVPAEIYFDHEGRVVTEMNTKFQSKNQLGDRYGMRQASSIGSEWKEEAAAFAGYVKGKTLDQVGAIGMNEDGTVLDADLISSVTISVSDFVKGIDEAVRNAEHQGARKGDQITLGLETTVEESEDAEGDDHGEASAHVSVVMETHDGQTVTSRETEEYTAGMKFNKNGQMTERVLDEE